MSNYIDKQRLAELILDARKNGMSVELIEVVKNIAKGLYGRYKFDSSVVSMNDFVQESIVLVLEKLNKIDLERGCFGFLTTCIINHYRMLFRIATKEREKLGKFAERMMRENPG